MARIFKSALIIAAIAVNGAAASDDACAMSIVRRLRANLISPPDTLIKRFLRTFDNSCAADIEYRELSCVLLYALLEKQPDAMLRNIQRMDEQRRERLFREMENPAAAVDIRRSLQNLARCGSTASCKLETVRALCSAARKFNTGDSADVLARCPLAIPGADSSTCARYAAMVVAGMARTDVEVRNIHVAGRKNDMLVLCWQWSQDTLDHFLYVNMQGGSCRIEPIGADSAARLFPRSQPGPAAYGGR